MPYRNKARYFDALIRSRQGTQDPRLPLCYGPTEAASANMAAPPLSANAGIAIATIRAATDTNIPMRLMLMSVISSPPPLVLRQPP